MSFIPVLAEDTIQKRHSPQWSGFPCHCPKWITSKQSGEHQICQKIPPFNFHQSLHLLVSKCITLHILAWCNHNTQCKNNAYTCICPIGYWNIPTIELGIFQWSKRIKDLLKMFQ